MNSESDVPEVSVVAGLGNPGQRYSDTRHNIGFLFLNYLAGSDLAGSGGGWRREFGAECLKGVLFGKEITLVKPLEFMNLSGRAIGQMLRFKKLSESALLVVHDDVDLPFGSLRIKQGGSNGGHNGLRSIESEIASSAYYRLRLGVGRPPEDGRQDLASWVLSKFSKAERDSLEEFFMRAAAAIEVLFKEGIGAAQNRYHG